jgi:outer membrane receptor protein involved in Fe transport
MHRNTPQRSLRVISKHHVLLILAYFVLATFANESVVSAQRITASLVGTTRDSSSAVIPNATVMVTNTGTNVVAKVQTNGDGQFEFLSLPPGPYTVTVNSTGFKQLVRSGLVLDVDQTAHLDLVLEIGSATEKIEVTSAEPLLETQTSDIGQVIGTQSIENLPLNQRNPFSLVLLVPGVTGSVNSTFTGLQFNVNGGRSGTTDILLDGVPSAPPTDDFNALTIFPSVDATQEFKVQTSNFSAQFGNTGGGVINVVYKSGTNNLHGSVYDFFRNSYLDANNFFSNRAGVKLPSFKRNQFGFSLGGPVYLPKLYNGRNKTFFFVDYEGLRQDTATQLLTTVPTLAERGGDFSADTTNSGAPITIYDPKSTVATVSPSGSVSYSRTAFSANKFSLSRFDPVAANLLKYFPLPNTAGTFGHNNYIANASAPYSINQYDIKVDEVLTDRQRMSFRFSKRNPVTAFAPLLPSSILVALNANTGSQPAIGAGLDYTFAKSPTYIFELRAGVSHVYFNTATPGDGFDPTTLGFPAYLAATALATSPGALTFPGIGPAGYLAIGSGSQLSKGSAGYLADTFLINNTKVLTHHTLNFGGEFRILANNDNQLGRATGNFSFGTNFTQGPNALTASSTTGDGFASFLLGLGSGSVTHFFKIVDTTSHYFGTYLQDDWAANDRLTLNLGVRYDLFLPRTERHNRATYLDLNVVSPLAATSGIAGLKGGLQYPGVNGNPRSVTDTDYNNFSPRIGFAYHPFNALVLRGAFGIFFTNNPNQAASTVQNTGFRTDSNYLGTIDGATPNNYLSDPFPGSSFVPVTGSSLGLLTGTGGAVSASIRRQPSPYTENYNLGIEYQLPKNWMVGISYVGSHGLQLPYYPTYNQLPDSALALGGQLLGTVANPFAGQVQVAGAISGTTIQKRYLLSPYPQFTSVTGYLDSGAISHYDSVQVRVEKRFSKNATLLLAYTGGKSMDDSSYGNNSNFGTNGVYQDASIPLFQDSYSLSTFDVSRNLVVSAVYSLPFGRDQRFGSSWSRVTDALLGGYQVNGIVTVHNGLPLAFSASNVANVLNPGERPNSNGQNASLGGRVEDRLNKYFNTSDFSQPATYTFGNMSRTSGYLRTPDLRNFDLSLFKQFALTERIKTELRGEAFNAFNTPSFSGPDTGVTDATFGVISAQANSPRQLQIALKILF